MEASNKIGQRQIEGSERVIWRNGCEGKDKRHVGMEIRMQSQRNS